MKRSQQEKQQTHQKIVNNASQQFRAEGVKGIGIAELMGLAGLTHGGFYAHFRNKDALVAEICGAGIEETLGKLSRAVDAAPAGAELSAFVDTYLSTAHRDNPAGGCTMPTLAADIARAPEEVQTAFTNGYEQFLERIISLLPEDETYENRRDAAIALLSEMVGAMLLSRAINDTELSERILRVGRNFPTATNPSAHS